MLARAVLKSAARLLIGLVLVAPLAAPAAVGDIVTVAGIPPFSGDGGPASAATFGNPGGVARDSAGNTYFSDSQNHRVRKIDVVTGLISTVAGNGIGAFSGDGGPATSASLRGPSGLALDAAGNLYIADSVNHRIRKVVAGTGVIVTMAGNGNQSFVGDGGTAISAALNFPNGVAVDGAGNLYIADSSNNRVRKVTAGTGIISTLTGIGAASSLGDGGLASGSSVNQPGTVLVDSSGNVYIGENGGSRIRKVTAATGVISTVVGTGVSGFSGDGNAATSARIATVGGMAMDGAGNLYFSDSGNGRVRKVAAGTGIISTVAGTGQAFFSGDGGAATSATMNRPTGLAVDGSGNLYIADYYNYRIRKVTSAGGLMSTVAGTGYTGYGGDGGLGTAARFAYPYGVAVDASGNIFIGDTDNHRIRAIAAATGIISTLAGNGSNGSSGDNGPATAASMSAPYGMTMDSAGNIYFADRANHNVRKIAAASGTITTVAGTGAEGYNGDGALAAFSLLDSPASVAVDSAGNLYIADTYNHRVRKVAAGSGLISTVAGNGQQGFSGDGIAATQAKLDTPSGVAIGANGNLYIADTNNNRIRMVSNGLIYTVAGNGTAAFAGDGGSATAASLYSPYSVALDAGGNLYITDWQNGRIRKVAAGTGLITTVAGDGDFAYYGDGGPATAAALWAPASIAVDRVGNLYIADDGNNVLRVVVAQQKTQTVAFTNPGAQFSGDTIYVAGSASSGLPVTFSSATPSFCSVSGNTVFLFSAGVCSVTASQGGNGLFSPATTTQTFQVSQTGTRAQAITFANPGAQTVGVQLELSASASSGLPVSFVSLTTSICTVSGRTVSFVAAGTCTISADQSGSAAYQPAPLVTQTFAVSVSTQLLPQKILMPNSLSANIIDGPKTINMIAYSSSGLPVTLTINTPGVCSVSGLAVTVFATGLCGVLASQGGNSVYAAASNSFAGISVFSKAGVPGPLAGITCTGGVGQATCNLSPPASDGGSPILYYQFDCGTLDAAGGTGTTGVGPGINTLPLIPGRPYFCSAYAVNAVGGGPESPLSNVFMTLTAGAVSPAPSITRVLAGNAQATVVFTGQASDAGGANLGYRAVSSPGGFSASCNAPCATISVPGLTNGTAYTFTVTATNGYGDSAPSAQSNPVTPLANLSVGVATPSLALRGGAVDIDGNGKSQIVLRSASGQLQVGRLSGGQFQFSAGSTLSPIFRYIAFGDFNGDGKSELAFQNITQGELGDVVVTPNIDLTGSVTVRSVKLPWLVEAVGDLDGDGYADMVFRFTGDDGLPNDTGVSYVWFMNGSAVKLVRKRGGAPLNWTLLGAADINGDLAADMVYISPANAVRVLMATPLRTCANISAGSLPSGVVALALADFTGFGKADIFYRDPVSGATGLMTLDASALTMPAPGNNPDDPNASCTSSNAQVSTSIRTLPTVSTSWQFYAAGDFNGDGYTDIVWLRPDGTLTLWLMGQYGLLPGVYDNVGSAPPGYVVLQP